MNVVIITRIQDYFQQKRNGWPQYWYQSVYIPQNYRVSCGYLGSISLADTKVSHVDTCALADPFLSRIPAIQYENWRIGHHIRKVPYRIWKL